MMPRRAATLALLLLVSLAGALPTTGAAAAATATAAHAAAPGKVVYFNLSDPQVRPRRIFTAYNSSPYLKALTWKTWGQATTTARGLYISDCASCAGPARRTALVTLSGLETCDDGLRTYRHAKVKVSAPDEGYTRTTYRLPTGCDLAPQG